MWLFPGEQGVIIPNAIFDTESNRLAFSKNVSAAPITVKCRWLNVRLSASPIRAGNAPQST